MWTIAIFDPFSSPQFLGEALRRRKIRSVAVYTREISPEICAHLYAPQFFDVVLHTQGWAEMEVERYLKRLATSFVLYGNEFAVPLADRIARVITPQSANDPATSDCRWNKYAMNQCITEHDLPGIRQVMIPAFLSQEDRQAIRNTLKFPLIVKPVQAGGTQGMAKCETMAEIETHLEGIPGEHLALCASQFVVQEFIHGEEYFVDTVSVQGEHQISGVFHNVKHYFSHSNIYQRTEIVDPTDPAWKQCTEYVLKVLDITGFNNGFAHTEVFMTENGPLLLEINPRISGASGYIQKITRLVYGWSQPDLLADALSCSSPLYRDYTLHSYGIMVYLNNWQENHQLSELKLSLLQGLPSFQETTMLFPVGVLVNPPVNLLQTIAFVLLHHPDRQVVEKDFRQIMAWEKAGMLF